eukprot:TRINITY_DN36939_c0_g1_i1.p1 TRINITY_DN36939_c0_g1~~TRINITY_DN36939_c0_g1_i1.p1  ORF type:complete len:290 (-),score=37.59 TRINITY_DN36939_c0_g1_i1:58-927(-)
MMNAISNAPTGIAPVTAMRLRMPFDIRLPVSKRVLMRASFTSCMLFAAGDILAQCIVEPCVVSKNSTAASAPGTAAGMGTAMAGPAGASSTRTFDPWRTLRYMTIGAFCHGPWVACTIPIIDRSVSHLASRVRLPRAGSARLSALAVMRAPRTVISSVSSPLSQRLGMACAKSLVTQIASLPAFLLIFFASAALLEGASPRARVTALFRDVYTTGWAYWPAVNVVTFGLMPPHWRVLWINVCGVAWNTFLCFVNGPVAATRAALRAAPGAASAAVPASGVMPPLVHAAL